MPLAAVTKQTACVCSLAAKPVLSVPFFIKADYRICLCVQPFGEIQTLKSYWFIGIGA
jgi:hypothetical protein